MDKNHSTFRRRHDYLPHFLNAARVNEESRGFIDGGSTLT